MVCLSYLSCSHCSERVLVRMHGWGAVSMSVRKGVACTREKGQRVTHTTKGQWMKEWFLSGFCVISPKMSNFYALQSSPQMLFFYSHSTEDVLQNKFWHDTVGKEDFFRALVWHTLAHVLLRHQSRTKSSAVIGDTCALLMTAACVAQNTEKLHLYTLGISRKHAAVNWVNLQTFS